METSTKYNGWANYATWNVATFLTNEESLYNLVKRYDNWQKAKTTLSWYNITETIDGISFDDPELDTQELDNMLSELS